MAHSILVVDDDPVIRVLLNDYLSSLGFEVSCAETGIQALEKLGQSRPDVMLLDFQMPVMTGLEVLKTIRKDPELSNLKVLVLSANKDTEKLFKGEGVSADQFIMKPFEMQNIRDALAAVLEKS